MADSLKLYYDYTIPQREYQSENIEWSSGIYTALTLAPEDTYSFFVYSITFMMTDNFAMGSGDKIELTINAYNNSPARTIEASSMEEVIAQGDLLTYHTNTFATWGKVHLISWVFKPPIYLKSSTSPTESIVLDYVESAGISLGRCRAICHLWNPLEAESGLS